MAVSVAEAPSLSQREPLPLKSRLRRRIFSTTRLIQVALIVALLVTWQIMAESLGSFILASPTEVVSAAREEVSSGVLFDALGQSVGALVVGFAIAGVIGVTVGTVMGMYLPLAKVLNPFINAGYVLPTAAIVPLLIIWFGIGLTSRVVTVVIFCVFEILISTYTGVRTVDRNLIDVARSFGANRVRIFQKVLVLAALPSIVAGLRMASSRAVQGVILAELLFASTGVGGELAAAANNYQTGRMFVYILTVVLVGVTLSGLMAFCEQRILGSRSGPPAA